MLIDYSQKKDGLDISYINSNNQISIEEIILDNGYYNYVECDISDPNKLKDLTSFKGSSIKIEQDKFFKHHNINEFFYKDIPKNYPDVYEKINKLNIPNPFSVDIEVMPTKEFGYSPPNEAKNPINAIAFTDKFLNTLVFVVKNTKHPEITAFDKSIIDLVIKDSLKHHYDKFEYNYNIRIFDTEIEMLNVFLECVNNHFHLIFGWNFLDYDWQYIYNRCERLGVDIKKASPTRKLTRKTIDINDSVTIELKTPSHRIVIDYMMLFKESLIYNNLGSYSLNSIADSILGIQKVEYEGNLRSLYEDNFPKFIAYLICDTILPMLIHKITNLLTVDFFQSYYTNVPYLKLSQNSISEALIYQELRANNMFLLETEKTKEAKRPYKGGFVKSPTVKLINAGLGIDYGSLYPNGMITNGISPEAKIDTILVDDFGYPINKIEEAKWNKYKSMGFCLAPTGRIYDITTDSLYVRVEKKLLTQRKIFKNHVEDIYLNIIPAIEKELKSRNL